MMVKMLINTKSKFAVIAMINLAKLSKESPVKLSELAKRQKLSTSYLEQLFMKLKRAELVESVRGPGGGYKLPSLDISVAQIVKAIKPPEPGAGKGWNSVSKQVGDSLNSIKLRDLLL